MYQYHHSIMCFGMAILVSILSTACAGPSLAEKKKMAKATRGIGEAYFREGNYSLALVELMKAEEMNPNDHFTQNDLGLCYMAKKRMTQAIGHFQKAITLKPDFAPAINNLGTAYLADRQWDKAIVTFKRITKDLLYATPHYPLSNLGHAYYNKGNYSEAEIYYLEALRIKPDFPISLRGLGRVYLAMNQSEKAVIFLEKAIRSNAKNPEYFMDLGNAYTAERDRQKALHAFKKVIELSPDSPLAEAAKKAIQNIY